MVFLFDNLAVADAKTIYDAQNSRWIGGEPHIGPRADSIFAQVMSKDLHFLESRQERVEKSKDMVFAQNGDFGTPFGLSGARNVASSAHGTADRSFLARPSKYSWAMASY